MNDLEKKYFTNTEQVIHLKKDELLIKKGDTNHRLFYLNSGKITVYDPDEKSEFFLARTCSFVGIISFFSNNSICRMNLIAMEDCTLTYIRKEDYPPDESKGKELAHDFMPLLIELLFERQQQIYKGGIAHNKMLEQMKDVERLISLGELSSGVAHELNNAITVIARGNEFITSHILELFEKSESKRDMVSEGFINGRIISSSEARDISKKFSKSNPIPLEDLRDYARTGMIKEIMSLNNENEQKDAFDLWNLGATLHDVHVAVKQSEHVVNSMRSLASKDILRQPDCDVNESIKKSLFLLASSTSSIQPKIELGELKHINGNTGELVQIWTNLIKNAVDAMHEMPVEKQELRVTSKMKGDLVQVIISDNGPGIPKNIRSKIFKPHVTTKKSGQTFGLGLGLPIVQKIINCYEADLQLDTSPSGTSFTVLLPTEK